MIIRLLTACLLALTATFAAAQSFETNARAAYVYDMTTGTVLLEKNADTPLPPASMSKLMTLYLAFEAISDGRLSPDDELLVSEHAMSYQGSSMFLRSGERVRVEDLIRGVIILSGNDASAVLAENLSPDGTEAGFARMMTSRAQDLGMMHSTFANSNGWPDPNQRMSVRDLGILAQHLITDFPTYYPIFAEEEFLFDGRVPSNSQNRNPILGLGLGADGMKTGHTQEAGYGLVGSAKQGDRRVVFVVTGLDSAAARAEEGQRILNWSFRQFAQKNVIETGTRVAEASVWMGQAPTVGLTVAEDVSMLVPILSGDSIDGEVVFNAPIEAPIAAGQTLGELIIRFDDLPERRIPLVAEADVPVGGFAIRMRTAVMVLLDKVMSNADMATTDDNA
ncbi:D-alanyl-D-alanine carboxypeptidase family protein [Marivivens sp. JLT3646]|jgi:D-alanyl-D-alanine carboxypeptidase (penicillin-binding protein 5/6)|uniref:D-alanyl-D-alanine carboxypeptidase family protein n=1 Tax=Marivivens sp. JLT3646 TaxID=1920883 RepID=UPI0007FE1770|nr:D-alanyl-D-alanine carboxypeptidase family protein [Marivivens sp. JLT3646]APO87279.1 D-alanyl-D-alanine carboxypeptidase [Marivivens sp. JLT3646]OBR35794.1 D-alanyl-D-alanine carboxypeptidase [Donghicola sp. JL3646]